MQSSSGSILCTKYQLPLLTIMALVFSAISYSQTKELYIKKLSPALQVEATLQSSDSPASFLISVNDTIAFDQFLSGSLRVSPKYKYPAALTYQIEMPTRLMLDSLLPRKEVLFIDRIRKAKEEVAVSNLDLSVNKVNLLQYRYPQFNGDGRVVSVKEDKPDTTDIDIKGRFISNPLSSSLLSSHATIISTIIGGAGNSYYEGKGVAMATGILSTSFANLLPEPDSYYQQYNINVQNHSYGTGIENYYGGDAAAYDASVRNNLSLLHVFSAGNSGALTAPNGVYQNLPGFANLTGSFKMAKNIITVGHIDSFGNVLAPSSRGPAYDGRLKPELVAYGLDGSSGAAAIVSGIALTIQHAYRNINGTLPDAALVKAVLFNSADDVGIKGIDFASGYGSVNAAKAMYAIASNRIITGQASQGSSQTFNITVPANAREVKLTLAWSDVAANANATKALKNDLDLELVLPATSERWLPWVLSHAPLVDSLTAQAKRRKDTLNNVEQISIDLPASGTYQLIVKGSIVAGNQAFAISYQVDTLNQFKWNFPIALDNIYAGRTNVIRWSSGYTNSTGRLEYSLDKGINWQLINPAVNLSTGYYKWTAPDSFVNGILKINIAGQDFVSDTFTISKKLFTRVGFNCPDSFLFNWDKAPGISRYQLYKLGNRYLEPLLVTTDTFIVLSKITQTATHYTIAPLIENRAGLKAVTFDYRNQGVDCYFRSFNAIRNGNTARLDLLLGTNYLLTTIVFEKWVNNAFVPIGQISNPVGTQFSFIDNSLLQGVNTYRVRLVLQGGRESVSETVTLYYAAGDFLLYPNPVRQNEMLHIVVNDLSNEVPFQVLDNYGRVVKQGMLDDVNNLVRVDNLAKGLYFIRFVNEGKVRVKRVVLY